MSMIAPLGPQQIGYCLCAAAFLLTAGWSAASALTGLRKGLMVAACLTSAAWALLMVFAVPKAAGFALVNAAEILRDAAWITFLMSMSGVGAVVKRLAQGSRPLALLAATLAPVLLFSLAVAAAQGMVDQTYPAIGLSILALVLIETLYRRIEIDARWGIKTLCVGLGLIFLFDFVFYADALFAGQTDRVFIEARGYADALAAPLLLLSVRRSSNWRHAISISRGVAFHSAVLLAGGLYLLAMAAIGLVLRWIGGSPAQQLVFLIATLLALLMVFMSKSVRSRARTSISKHFFSHKYDYREVWLKFIRDISHNGQGGDLHNRVLHALADIFDCPAGALWVLDQDAGSFVAKARWNLGEDLPPEPADGALACQLVGKQGIVAIEDFRRRPKRYAGVTLPAWLENLPRAGLLAPLIHNSRLQAFIVLGTPRAAVEIDWEELDLLTTLCEQAASYLAEEQSLRALVEASRLEEFNRWSAFLVHDIKGIVGQMALLVANAEQHAHDHAFQRDVVATVANAVMRMRKLLEQLHARQAPPSAESKLIDAVALLRQVGDRWRRSIPSLQLADTDRTMLIEAREEALVCVLDHLIQNALEASGADGQIILAQRWLGDEGMLEVRDNGPGMEPGFVRDQLFKPLNSSKPQGFGLGAFQVRQLVRGMGGRLEVDSSPGNGTTMRVRLPIFAAGDSVLSQSRESQ